MQCSVSTDSDDARCRIEQRVQPLMSEHGRNRSLALAWTTSADINRTSNFSFMLPRLDCSIGPVTPTIHVLFASIEPESDWWSATHVQTALSMPPVELELPPKVGCLGDAVQVATQHRSILTLGFRFSPVNFRGRCAPHRLTLLAWPPRYLRQDHTGRGTRQRLRARAVQTADLRAGRLWPRTATLAKRRTGPHGTACRA